METRSADRHSLKRLKSLFLQGRSEHKTYTRKQNWSEPSTQKKQSNPQRSLYLGPIKKGKKLVLHTQLKSILERIETKEQKEVRACSSSARDEGPTWRFCTIGKCKSSVAKNNSPRLQIKWGNTAAWPNGWLWMSQSRKFPKRTSSKQTSRLESRPWLTTHWLQEPHQESHKLKVLLHIYWELLQRLGPLTDLHCGGNALEGSLIFLTYRWERKWSFTMGCVE